jgi:hypothetical protein
VLTRVMIGTLEEERVKTKLLGDSEAFEDCCQAQHWGPAANDRHVHRDGITIGSLTTLA